jgi:hypothetical protein
MSDDRAPEVPQEATGAPPAEEPFSPSDPEPPHHHDPFRNRIGAGFNTVRRSRRWVVMIAVAAAVLIVGGWWFLLGPGRRIAPAPGHFVPLAAELEGIRGVYLYYGVAGTDSMTAEYRDVVVKDRSSDRVRAIFRELIAGPTDGKSPFPEGTELLNTYETPRGTLYLDWNRTFLTGFRGGSGLEHQILSSIVLTAGDNLPEVERVVVLVEGSPVPTLGGHYDILTPLDVADWR